MKRVLRVSLLDIGFMMFMGFIFFLIFILGIGGYKIEERLLFLVVDGGGAVVMVVMGGGMGIVLGMVERAVAGWEGGLVVVIMVGMVGGGCCAVGGIVMVGWLFWLDTVFMDTVIGVVIDTCIFDLGLVLEYKRKDGVVNKSK